MTGLEGIEPRTGMALEKALRTMYPPELGSPEELEDLILLTPERENWADIGMGKKYLGTVKYMVVNAFWINVCLFVNADFRECFHDAILIEKALLQVTDSEYADFRDDMVLADAEDRDMYDRQMAIDFSRYSSQMDSTFNGILAKAKQQFFEDGMSDAYDELANGFDRETKESVAYVVANMAYVANAMDLNGVFNKYVHLVVDSVIEQLAPRGKK